MKKTGKIKFVFLLAILLTSGFLNQSFKFAPPESITLSSRRMRNQPIRLIDFLRLRRKSGIKSTLLAVTPLSEMVVRATLEAARDNDYPVLFAASRDQIDIGGGYTGWDAKELFSLVSKIAKEVGYKGPIFMGREHAGPWTNYYDVMQGLTEKEAMERAKASFTGRYQGWL